MILNYEVKEKKYKMEDDLPKFNSGAERGGGRGGGRWRRGGRRGGGGGGGGGVAGIFLVDGFHHLEIWPALQISHRGFHRCKSSVRVCRENI